MKQKKVIFNFFVNRNWKKLTDSRKIAEILADNRKSHHPIETLVIELSVMIVVWRINDPNSSSLYTVLTWHMCRQKSILVSQYFKRFITSHITCNTKNVIYMVQCNRCNLQYIGETKRRLKDRFNEHRSAVDKTNIKLDYE